MRIGVVSDSHGDIYALKRAITHMGDIDMIIHLGDYTRDAAAVSKELGEDIICVRGNCDYSSTAPAERILTIEDIKVLATHGYRYNVKSDCLGLYFKAQQEEAGLVLFGHTHFAEVFEKEGITFVNPGSVSKPRGTSETYAVITVEGTHIYANIVPLY